MQWRSLKWQILLFSSCLLGSFTFTPTFMQILGFWMLSVSQIASIKITLVQLSGCLCVYLSVCPLLNFLKIGSLIFAGIVHDNSWPWYLVIDEAIFLKKNWQPEFGLNEQKSDPDWGFLAIFFSLDHKFSLKLFTVKACDNA